jgi:SAM-dependent methyltransferase
MTPRLLSRAATLVVAGLLLAAGPAFAKDRKECDRLYKPTVGQPGKDVVWVPTPDELVSRMLRMAKVAPQDLVYDLGAGDGKIAIAAARLGATSVGIEYNPDMARLAQCYVEADGVAGKARIIRGDIFKEDFSKATVITMYLLPELNLCVRHRILAMKPGTRATSHQFTMGDWEADETADIDYRSAYLWIVPAKVGGDWSFREQNGSMQFAVTLNQTYQKVSGDVTIGNAKQPLVGATLRGDEIRFAFNDANGVTRTLVGNVRGNEIAGVLRAAGGGDVRVNGAAQGALKTAPWAEMAQGCSRFYK